MLFFLSSKEKHDYSIFIKYASYYKLNILENLTFSSNDVSNLLIFAICVLKECGSRVGISDTQEKCEPGKLHVSKKYYEKIKNELQYFLHICKEFDDDSYMISTF